MEYIQTQNHNAKQIYAILAGKGLILKGIYSAYAFITSSRLAGKGLILKGIYSIFAHV